MNSIISLHIGAPGIRIAASLWDLLNTEIKTESDVPERTFEVNAKGEKRPKALLLDTDREMENFIAGQEALERVPALMAKEGTGGLATEAHYSVGREVVEKTDEEVRKLVEGSETLDGFALFYSLSGGTGSGLTTLLLDRPFMHDLGPKLSFLILPNGDSVVDAYNFVLGIGTLTEHSDLVLAYENCQMGKVSKVLGSELNYEALNSIVAQTSSNLFAQKSNFSTSFTQLSRNFESQNRYKFAFPRLSLNLPQGFNPESDFSDMQNSVLSGNCCPLIGGKTLSTYIQLRGDWSTLSAEQYISQANSCPKDAPFSYHVYDDPRPVWGLWQPQEKSAFILESSTGLKTRLKRILHDFDRMYAKRSHVHWYVGIGISEGEFSERREEAQTLVNSIE